MSITTLDKLRSDREGLVGEITALQDADSFDPTDSTYVEARSRAESMDTKIASIVEFNQRRAAANQIDAISVNHKQVADKNTQTREAPGSLGEAWTRSPAYANFKDAPRGTSGRVTLRFRDIQERALIKTDTFTGIMRPDRIAPSTAPALQTPLLDVISNVRVGTNSVEWVYFPAAAPLGTVTAEGTPKTEAAVAPLLKTVTLSTIASWAQYSRQFGEDAPGLVDFLNQSLGRGIMDKRESLAAAALISGSSGIPALTPGVGTMTLLEAIRAGIAKIQTAGYRPSAVALNPADFAKIDIELLGKTLNGPIVGSQFWGVTPIPVGAIPAGTAYVGDFGVAMVELVREDVTVYTTDSDILPDGSSAFRANVLTTIVEGRSVPIVHRPEALVKVAEDVTP